MISVIAAPIDVFMGNYDGAQIFRAIGAYVISMGPVAMASGLFAAVVSGLGRWMWSTVPVGSAVLSGACAAMMGMMVTFLMLWAPMAPVLQVTWIIAVAAATVWASLRVDSGDDWREVDEGVGEE